MKEIFLDILAFLGFSEGSKIANEVLGLVADGKLQQAVNNIANLGNKVSSQKVNEALIRLQQVPQIKSFGLQNYIRKVQGELEKDYKDQVDLQSDIMNLNTNVQNQLNEYANQSGLKRFMENTADKEKDLIKRYSSEINALDEDKQTVNPSIEVEEKISTPLDIFKGYQRGSKTI